MIVLDWRALGATIPAVLLAYWSWFAARSRNAQSMYLGDTGRPETRFWRIVLYGCFVLFVAAALIYLSLFLGLWD